MAAYNLSRPVDSVGVQFVTPASQATTTPTTTPTSAATTAVPSKSTTTKATAKTTAKRTREVTVSEPQTKASTTPPAPDDPIRTVVPAPVPGNITPGVPLDAQGTPSTGSK